MSVLGGALLKMITALIPFEMDGGFQSLLLIILSFPASLIIRP